MRLAGAVLVALGALAWGSELEQARDRQDRAALKKTVEQLAAVAAKSPGDAAGHYRLALASSYLAEVAIEQRDKAEAAQAAERGIQAAERAVALDPRKAEHHRILGTLCGQIIPANVLRGLRYGRCAREQVDKAIELAPQSELGYLSRAVGNYYLPPAFGGGVEPALRDLRKALELNPRSAEAHLWMGIVLRKANRNAEARQALARSLELNPNRVWAKQQLDKTPAQ
ncbi:MAG: tetratricopeptide repeat protein [Acidobacteria bacterium]|nr:tetratricopeptide repeat protein [Acidobacteriota bacterium]MBI3278279.1 tetratricopeptide repeat protein [Acidobacteriota bacterium]